MKIDIQKTDHENGESKLKFKHSYIIVDSEKAVEFQAKLIELFKEYAI